MSESRGGFNVRHIQHGKDVPRGQSGTRGDRVRLLREAMRDRDAADAARQAARNSSIVPEDTAKNWTLVNDGNGGFRRALTVDEVVAYGDERAAKVRRKIRETSFETTTMVAWAPTDVLREVPDYYPVMKNGEEVGRRSRWIIDDEKRFQEWVDATVGYVENDVLTGGHDAIHAVIVNVDESRPHIHIMCDTFAPDPKAKKPGDLRVEASQMWGSHRDVREERVDPKTGKTKLVQITGATKMRRYQQGYHDRLIERGFAIEREANPEGQSLEKSAFAHLETEKTALETEWAALDGREAALTAREKAVAEAEAEIPAMRAAARREGHAEGREEGLAGAAEERAALLAAARREATREKLEVARRAEAAAAEIERKTREKADAKLEEALEAADQVIRAQIDAAEKEIAEETRAAAADLKNHMPALVFDAAERLPAPAGYKGENAYEVISTKVNELVKKDLGPGASRAAKMARIRETMPERAARRKAAVAETLRGVRSQDRSKTQDRDYGMEM